MANGAFFVFNASVVKIGFDVNLPFVVVAVRFITVRGVTNGADCLICAGCSTAGAFFKNYTTAVIANVIVVG